MGPVQQTLGYLVCVMGHVIDAQQSEKKKKNWHENFVFFAREFRVFRSILVQLKGVGLSCFHSFDRL